MESLEYIPVSGTVLKKHNDWLNFESRRRALPKSALLREAIELLMKKYKEAEEAGKNEGYLFQGQSEVSVIK